MRKFLLPAILLIASIACSTGDLTSLLQPATPTPLPTLTSSTTPTASLTPTITGTLPTPTFTFTPTLIGQRPTETATVPPTPDVPVSPEATGTPELRSIIFTGDTGFISATLSSSLILYGSCEPFEVDFDVQVADPERTAIVALFLRLREKASGEDSGWDIGTSMNLVEPGLFTLLLDANTLHADENYARFSEAWVEFQLVALDSGLSEIGRTEKVVDALTLSACPQP